MKNVKQKKRNVKSSGKPGKILRDPIAEKERLAKKRKAPVKKEKVIVHFNPKIPKLQKFSVKKPRVTIINVTSKNFEKYFDDQIAVSIKDVEKVFVDTSENCLIKPSPPLIYKQISAVMADIGAITKDREFKAEKFSYRFRGIDDVYNALHKSMAKYKIFSTSKILNSESDEKTNRSNTLTFMITLTIEYTFWAEDGSHVSTTVIGVGHDTGDKHANKALAVGHKYALLQLFCIPTEEKKDPEEDALEMISNGLKSPKKASTEGKKTDSKTPGSKRSEAPEAKEKEQSSFQFKLADGKNIWVNRFELLSLFADLKKTIGEEDYYLALEKFGIHKANEIQSGAHFQTIYNELTSTLKEKGAAAKVESGLTPQEAAIKAQKLILLLVDKHKADPLKIPEKIKANYGVTDLKAMDPDQAENVIAFLESSVKLYEDKEKKEKEINRGTAQLKRNAAKNKEKKEAGK